MKHYSCICHPPSREKKWNLIESLWIEDPCSIKVLLTWQLNTTNLHLRQIFSFVYIYLPAKLLIWMGLVFAVVWLSQSICIRVFLIIYYICRLQHTLFPIWISIKFCISYTCKFYKHFMQVQILLNKHTKHTNQAKKYCSWKSPSEEAIECCLCICITDTVEWREIFIFSLIHLKIHAIIYLWPCKWNWKPTCSDDCHKTII